MPTVRDVRTKAEVVRAIQRMLDALLHEPTSALATGAMISRFNDLLQHTKEQFRTSDTLRLIGPVDVDASVALIVVRLSIVKRTIDRDRASAIEEAS